MDLEYQLKIFRSFRGGELHVPLEVCGAVVKRELDYWQITEDHIKSCCWRNYRIYIENQRILEAFNHSVLINQFKPIDNTTLTGWEKYRTKIWLILEYPRTSREAFIFGIISLSFVVLSILGFCLETLPYLRPVNVTLTGNSTGKCEGKNITVNYVLQPNEVLNILDIICTTFFTVELIVRFIFSPDKFRFIRNAMNIIDLLALVPLYMQLILNTDAFKFCYMNERVIFEIMFILRIIRMFRIFHLVKHYQALQILVYALKASIQELLMLLIFLLIGMLVFATMIYYAEREDAFNQGTQFSTIPLGFWWAIITMTTVGYGDIAPSTPLGYIVGTMCAICGVLMVALTIPVISNNFTLFYTHVRSRGGRRNSSEGLDKDLFLINHDDANSFESARQTSHGSLIPSVDHIPKRRRGRKHSEISTLSANAGRFGHNTFGHNGDVRYGLMAYDAAIIHKPSSSMTDITLKNNEVAYYETNENSTVKTLSEDCVVYSDCHTRDSSSLLTSLISCMNLQGELHVPLEVCGAVVKRELDYWQITENHIKSCCWRNYRSYIENKRILDSFNRSILKQQMCIDTDGLKGWEKYRTKMWLILEYPRTSRAAMTFGIVSLMFVVLSILGFCLETLPALRPENVTVDNSTRTCDGKNVSTTYMLQPNAGLNILDIICTAFFTAELIIRFTFSPNKWRFVRSAMNIIDLLALVPLYMQLILNSEAFKFCYMNERLIFEIMFILRIIRMFRIFHLVKHYQALQILIYALKASIQELLMLLIFLLIGMLVFATMIYYAEREDAVNPGSSKFPTIPVGFWWAIITMTTVGYGDVAPTQPIGYVVGTCCAVSGVLMVALTIPVISNNFTLFYTHVRSRGGSNSTQDLHDINSEILLHSEDGAKVYENARRTSNGSIIMNEKSFTLARKGSDISALTADPYTNGKCGHNGDVRYGRMLGDTVPRHTTSTSMSDVDVKHGEVDYYVTHAGAVKAHSDDGVMYSGTML